MTKQQNKTQPGSRKTKTVDFDTVRQLGLALPGVEEGLVERDSCASRQRKIYGPLAAGR